MPVGFGSGRLVNLKNGLSLEKGGLSLGTRGPWYNCERAASQSSPLGPDTVPCGCQVCVGYRVEQVTHGKEGAGSLLGSAWAGW